jgi:BMFP domain-containing protein YqiC
VAAVAVQSLNTDARLVVAALKAREQEELERRLEELEALVQSHKQQEGGRWGA